jgi:anthraniloyl-CoA monooxygenase
MRIAVAGGGPAGLYFAALAKQLNPDHEITVWERNAADDTFGFGVVFSDETLTGIELSDPVVHARLQAEFARWDDIDVHYQGWVITSGGHGFAAMGRRRLLQILQERCRQLGVEVNFRAEADLAGLAGADLVVAADGVNSRIRAALASHLQPSVQAGRCRYMWLGTDRVFDAFKFYIRPTRYGLMQAHCYPFDERTSTFIVEMHEDVWRRAFPDREPGPGESDQESIELIGRLFSDVLDGSALLANNSRWLQFPTVRAERWSHGSVVLLGDAAHTAHFSIGSGTKLAMEDALALAACVHEQPDLPGALEAFELERKPVVASVQRAALASQQWFENLGQYVHQEPMQFTFNLLTRSRRVTYDNLRLRDPEFAAAACRWFAGSERRRGHGVGEARPPMFQPFRLGGLELANRVVVSPMDMYVSENGRPGDFHLVHLGGKALGGAGLVMTEMVCVSPEGRITPGCGGLWTDEQAADWGRVCDFVHSASEAKIGLQLGHSGPKGSTKLMWEGIDDPLNEGNWAVVGASAVPYRPGVNQMPRELTGAQMEEVTGQFVAAALRAEAAGFDLIELHCAHGYLLSSFISPLTNQRTDGYGGSVQGRLRFPLEVFGAVRSVWPASKPMTVRISATDWADGGISMDDTLAVARAFADAGAAAIDVSTGQVTSREQPAFGRSYQTPFADAIRNRLGIPTIAVGVISSYDDVNTILLSGRADLCALGRAHLYDPNWTLHAAVEQDYDLGWPLPWRAGQRKPQTGRTDGPKPRLDLVRAPVTRHVRWRPGERQVPAGAQAPELASR